MTVTCKHCGRSFRREDVANPDGAPTCTTCGIICVRERKRCHAALKRVFTAFLRTRTFPASLEVVEVAWLAELAKED